MCTVNALTETSKNILFAKQQICSCKWKFGLKCQPEFLPYSYSSADTYLWCTVVKKLMRLGNWSLYSWMCHCLDPIPSRWRCWIHLRRSPARWWRRVNWWCREARSPPHWRSVCPVMSRSCLRKLWLVRRKELWWHLDPGHCSQR